MNKKTLFILALGIILLGAVVVGLVFCSKDKAEKSSEATPIIDHTESAKTAEINLYANDKFGYSLEYGDEWTFREFPSSASGAGFRLKSVPDEVENEMITVNIGRRTLNDRDIPFEQYVKEAAPHEIQNYKNLVSVEKLISKSGLVGYKTTWNIQPIIPSEQEYFISDPIYYFDYGNSDGDTIQLICREEYSDVCDEMAKTVTIIKSE